MAGSSHISLYCDGGCRNNQNDSNVGGWGVLLLWRDAKKELRGSAFDTTNNKMELTACIEGLRAIKNKTFPVDVYLDSSYVLNGITGWIKNWQRNGWKTKSGTDVLNKELWLDLLDEKKKFKEIYFHKVRGHTNNAGNNRADELVNLAMDGA